MKPEHISDALNQLSDEVLEETDQVRTQQSGPRRKWRIWAIAACLCVVIAGAAILPRLGERTPAIQPGGDLPLLEVSLESGGMGFEGLLYYDFSEMNNGNPWHEGMVFDTLPVYRNSSYIPAAVGSPIGLSVEEMEQRIQSAAQALGVEITGLEQNYDSFIPTEVYQVEAQADGLRFTAEGDGTVTVYFDGGLPLPEEYSFTYSDTADQEAEEVLDYLIDRYAALLNFQQPEKVLRGEYNIYAEFDRDYHVFDAAGDDVEDLLNYAFHYAQFAPDDAGNLSLIRLYDVNAEKIGDYPIISLEEAREALLAGQYLTTVPYDFPGGGFVYGGELIYHKSPASSRWDQTFMPYYRFYVDISHEFPHWTNGLKNYGAYYVPAVQHQYLKPGWEWDRSFH